MPALPTREEMEARRRQAKANKAASDSKKEFNQKSFEKAVAAAVASELKKHQDSKAAKKDSDDEKDTDKKKDNKEAQNLEQADKNSENDFFRWDHDTLAYIFFRFGELMTDLAANGPDYIKNDAALVMNGVINFAEKFGFDLKGTEKKARERRDAEVAVDSPFRKMPRVADPRAAAAAAAAADDDHDAGMTFRRR